jgi:hypothetical protein
MTEDSQQRCVLLSSVSYRTLANISKPWRNCLDSLNRGVSWCIKEIKIIDAAHVSANLFLSLFQVTKRNTS